MFKIYKPIGGDHYKRIVVKDPEPYLQDGWYLSIADHQEPIETQKADDDILPPTRLEMEIKASLLGIKYDGRTSDKKLLERIEEALK
jgi:hypothetical protein